MPLNSDLFLFFFFFTHAWIKLLAEDKTGHDTNQIDKQEQDQQHSDTTRDQNSEKQTERKLCGTKELQDSGKIFFVDLFFGLQVKE